MAMEQQQLLKQDGYLDLGIFVSNEVDGGVVTRTNSNISNNGVTSEARHIVYHPNLNVILAFDTNNQVKVLDVHSGVILQSYQLGSNDSDKCINGRFMPLQEKVLFWDGNCIGFRGDYNGVLLLDTILQTPTTQNDDVVKIELLLSEAIIFQTCLKDLEQEGLECQTDVSNELQEKIQKAQSNPKKGIKAQRWATICMEVSYASLKLVANNVVIMLKRLERHIPVLAIASAINERLTDLLFGARLPDLTWHSVSLQRVLMHSEAVRRQTFEKWPHMDYKWALPDQMAQAGFYHQPSTSGEDRAMCFTCSVCLVCWEKTDEPWSEHERHSPMCPFVKGEYTQNVPLSVTYATNPAVPVPGLGFDVISNSDYANVLCTSCTKTGDLTIWSIERHLKKMHTFNIATLMKDICDESYEWARVTAICVLPNERAKNKIAAMQAVQTGHQGGSSQQQCTSTSTLRNGVVGSKVILGMSIRQTTGEHVLRMVVLNIIESDKSFDESNDPDVSDDGGGGETDQMKPKEDDISIVTDKETEFKSSDESHQSEQQKNRDNEEKKTMVVAIKQSSVSAGTQVSLNYDSIDDAKIAQILEDVQCVNMVNNANGLEFHGNTVKKKILDSAHVIQNKSNNNSESANNVNNMNNSSISNNSEETIKMILNEEIDCIVDSCTSINRMNAIANINGSNAQAELVEITEIIPTSSDCTQLLVKLQKTRVPNENKSQIIMAAIEDDEQMQDSSETNADHLAAQLLLFDVVDSVISNEYTLAVAFNKEKCPRQLCILPALTLQTERRSSDPNIRNIFAVGTVCVVCADGSIELYSLLDSSLIASINEENEQFVSVAYCRSLDRLCACTKSGGLFFYTLNDTDNDSGDECVEMEDETATVLNISHNAELSVPDGGNLHLSNKEDVFGHDLDSSTSPKTTGTSAVSSNSLNSQTSFSTSSSAMGSNNNYCNVILAYKQEELTLDDLKTMYALTQFDDKLSMYTAEVSNCWNDLAQTQKQRKQPQAADDTQFYKTWRLHNDATTWDEHIIELNLTQQISLGHVDLKFTVYQQSQTPAAGIQVTLLKQNTSGFGYRMKGPQLNFKSPNTDQATDVTFNTFENPVLNEEYLQAHNAEIIAGPIELSSCIDMYDQGGTAILTSPKLFKTRTRNFLLHIKTVSDPTKESQNKSRVTSSKISKTLNNLPSTKEQCVTHIIKATATTTNFNKTKDKEKKTKIKYFKYEADLIHFTPELANQLLKKIMKKFHLKNSVYKSIDKDHGNESPKKQSNKETTLLGCDWLHEISIHVRGVKNQRRIMNERLQRISMLESNILLQNLFKIVSAVKTSILERNIALDILIWICFIRLTRFRSPKSERIKNQINKQTASQHTDLLAQQFECICVPENNIEGLIRFALIQGDRSMAHKCVKLLLILINGHNDLPPELRAHSTLKTTIMKAMVNTFPELPTANYASVVRWYIMLIFGISNQDNHHEIANLCVKMLGDITTEIENRSDPYCALLSTRYGLYGFPFDPEIFDFNLPNLSKGLNSNSAATQLMNVLRPNPILLQAAGMDVNKLSSIDGVDFRTFPHLIKCKSISNQFRGLLEVEQLHFNCVATSEATRIDTLDITSTSGSVPPTTTVNMDDIMMAPLQANSVDPKDLPISNKMIEDLIDIDEGSSLFQKAAKIGIAAVEADIKSNGNIGIDLTVTPPKVSIINESQEGNKYKVPLLPKIKAICQFIENCDDVHSEQKAMNQSDAPSQSDESNLGQELLEADLNFDNVSLKVHQYLQKQILQKKQYLQKQLHLSETAHQIQIHQPPSQQVHNDKPQTSSSQKAQKIHQSQQTQATSSQKQKENKPRETIDNTYVTPNVPIPWHKILTAPPKQMIVIDRMHSGARRHVVLDFGAPIVLTDIVMPACDELATLYIDVWCFDEDTDCQRLINSNDIALKTLVLSDIQPPPICRYLKITIVGRIGMSSTKCKIPIGCFFGHNIILEHDAYGDLLIGFMKSSTTYVQIQMKALQSLYEDVHCRYNLASCKLMELLTPILNSEMSNAAHMQAFINKQREDEQASAAASTSENAKIVNLYEECILLQHQMNVIRNVIKRMENNGYPNLHHMFERTEKSLQLACRDKLRVLSSSLVEVLLHFSIEYGIKNIFPMHETFNMSLANQLFNSLVVHGDAHIQLATCSLLVRMCCFQNWWGDFLADLFCSLFSSQNSRIFPQDRIFFLLTYLGRRSIAMGTCRSIVIDAILKTLAKLLSPMSVWSKSDYQLITWLLLFLSVCLDDNNDRKDKTSSRWDFMSCESDFGKARVQCANPAGKQLRCFKKRIIQQNKFGVQPYSDWSKKIFMIQNEHPGILMEMTGKPPTTSKISKPVKPSSSSSPKPSTSTASQKENQTNVNVENNFDKGLKAIRLSNILVVIRGLIAFLLDMDFYCNMDQFLLTCKVIARLVSACRPVVQLSKIITTSQLEQLVRLSVWNDQQQPWAVHAITCLLQDLLDADKHFKDLDATPTNERSPVDDKMMLSSFNNIYMSSNLNPMPSTSNEAQFGDASGKYSILPSLIEYEDTEYDDLLNEMEMIDRVTPVTKKESTMYNKSTLNYFCKTISRAMDSRLDVGLELNVETQLRRMTNDSSLHMFSSLPQILANEFVTTSQEPPSWPDYIVDAWSGPEYNTNQTTFRMFKEVFDCIFADLHLEDTWVHLEQVLQMWLTLNGELSDKTSNDDPLQSEMSKIPFGANAVQGLLLALVWHSDIKLRTWCLGFQCLYLACNNQNMCNMDEDADTTRINEVIICNENFEKMLLRFFSGYGMNSSIITNRCAGPTICKHLHELLMLLFKRSDDGILSCKRKLKDALLHVVLQLVQPGGAIANQQGPIDAQSQMVRDLLNMPTDKIDQNVAMSIIECISFLVYNNVSNGEKLQCQRASDNTNSSNAFSNLFANVLGSENSKQSAALSDNSLLISLIKLATTLIQAEVARQPSEVPIPEDEELSNQSTTDETKAEQLTNEAYRVKTSCIADSVLKHFPTMKRLLGTLSQYSTATFSMMTALNIFKVKLYATETVFDEPQSVPDAVFYMLTTLSEKATHSRLIVAPICQYLEISTSPRNALPRLQLSEPFLWYISRILENSMAVQIFTQLGGIQIICQNLVRLNKLLFNMQPGLISLIMQHMTKNTKCKLSAGGGGTGNNKKASSSAPSHRNYEGLINFAPFCTISSENETAQSADILIMNPIAPHAHRRQRTPSWSYMFYPNESYVDLTVTLPAAILLKEVQLQPHTPTLASCPSAVAIEISRDYGVTPIPVGPPITTTGLTCIRLKLSKPEIASVVVLRLYRPKDSSSIGLTQLAVLGHTIFTTAPSSTTASFANNSGNNSYFSQQNNIQDQSAYEDGFAKTSVGWIRILSRCFNTPAMYRGSKLATDVIGASATYPGFLEACCSLLNILPIIPNSGLHKLESVMLQLASFDVDISLNLLKILLWRTTPQVFKITNESISDLLYEICILKDGGTVERVKVLLEWIVDLQNNFSAQSLRCNNPQSGYVKVIASILWTIYTENYINNLTDLLSPNIFESCMHWVSSLQNDEPLKNAFDSLLCSLCCIKPELFNELLKRLKVNVIQTYDNSSYTNKMDNDFEEQDSEIFHPCYLTDDKKDASGSEWFAQVAKGNLSIFLSRPNHLSTLAMAAQSSLAIYQLIESDLPKLLAHAIYEFCCQTSLEVKMIAMRSQNTENEDFQVGAAVGSCSSSWIPNGLRDYDGPSTSSSIDTDKAGKRDHSGNLKQDAQKPFNMTGAQVARILDFFAACCAEGHMRDWLGTKHGTIFWRPLLELLCNYRPYECDKTEPLEMSLVRLERATINFFSRVTACHYKNSEILTSLLILVIRKSDMFDVDDNSSTCSSSNRSNDKCTISGFTRQFVLQLLLEDERIQVSVRSKKALKQRDVSPTKTYNVLPNGTGNNLNGKTTSCVTVCLSSNHPSKRVNGHHLLFNCSVNTEVDDILQQCSAETRPPDIPVLTVSSNVENQTCSTGTQVMPNDKLVSMESFGSGMDLNLNGLENGMEFLSVAAGVTAKGKRIKDAKNQVAANKEAVNPCSSDIQNKVYQVNEASNASNFNMSAEFILPHIENVYIPGNTTLSQLLAIQEERGFSKSGMTLELITNKGEQSCYAESELASNICIANTGKPLQTPLQRFSKRGGLSLLAKYLPTVYPECTVRKASTGQPDKERSPPMADWVKLEPSDDIYEDLEDPITEPVAKNINFTAVPQHSLAAFGLFLRLPAYSDVLLKDMWSAQCLLRLVLGVTGDGEGNDIYSSTLAPTLPTLPFEVFRKLLDNSSLTNDDGMLLRKMVIDVGAMHLVLNCLSIFTHQSQNGNPTNIMHNENTVHGGNGNIKMSSISNEDNIMSSSDDKSHVYWAKGTGFGTGSTTQSWNVEQALMRQKSEEEHVTILLQVLSSYINPGDCIPPSMQNEEILAYHKVSEGVSNELPKHFYTLLEKSCLITALSSYLRNDSVMDITRHIPLYRAILQLLRALTLSQQLVTLLQPNEEKNEISPSIAELLNNMKTCVDTYAKRLKINKKSNLKSQTQQVTVNIDDGDDEGLALLIPDIQETSFLVQKTTNADVARRQQKRLDEEGEQGCSSQFERIPPPIKSLEQRYLELMKKLQFDTYDMIVEAENNGYRFTLSHHFEKTVRMAGDRYHPSRVKRLAQEAVTLSTSLPLSYSSSVFVRCDTDRLDIMKVLITGPAETPYANGCFEFDVFFPPDYPNLPMLINLETTGRHSVRFNPNLYNDGKVCLSVLNTWHGRPEEKWNAQTSSFLQVLVSIQSLILVPEPYFNEPGFERSRGTPNGTHSSREYNTNIYQACVRWAMLEQIRNPSPCFKEIIHTHFWLKRNEICEQIESWIEELGKPKYSERNSRTVSFNSMVLRRHYRHLREELAKLPVPAGLEDLDAPFSSNTILPSDFPINTSSIMGLTAAGSTTTFGDILNEVTMSLQSPASPDNTPSSSQSVDPAMEALNIIVDADKMENSQLGSSTKSSGSKESYAEQMHKFMKDEVLLLNSNELPDESVSVITPTCLTLPQTETTGLNLIPIDTDPHDSESNQDDDDDAGHDDFMETQSETTENNGTTHEDVPMPLYFDNEVIIETVYGDDMDTSYDDS